jgi:hypothetical protein
MQAIAILKENGDMAAVPALNRRDVGKLNEFVAVFTRIIKCMKVNFVSYFGIFSMLQKLMMHSQSLCANKCAETLIQVYQNVFHEQRM